MGNKRPLWIPLAGGISTDIVDDLLPLGRSLEITNMQLAETGKLVKRFGTISFETSGAAQSWQLVPYKGSRVSLAVVAGGISPPTPLSVYSPTKGSWVSPATDRRSPLTVATTKLPTKGGTNPRIATGAGYLYLLYQDLTQLNVMHFDVIDQTTLAVVSAQTFSTAGSYLAFGLEFCNGLAVAITEEFGVGVVFHTLTPSTLGITATTYVAAPLGNLGFDSTVKNATTISVVYQIAGNIADAVDFVPGTLATTGWSPRDATAATINIFNGAAWVDDLGGSGKQALVTCGSVQGVRVQWDIPVAGATRQAARTDNADPAATASVIQAEGHTTSNSATGDYQVMFTIAATPSTNNLTKMAVRSSGVLTAGFALYRSISLLSKAFTYNGEFYALFCFSLDTDANSYAMRIPAVTSQPTLSAPQAIFAAGSSGNVNQFGAMNGQLVRVLASGFTFTTAINFLDRITKTAAAGYGPTLGSLLVRLVFVVNSVQPSTGIPIEAFDGLIVPGGAIGHFDGLSYGEIGFPYQGLQSTALTPAAGGGLTASSVYWYSFVWARMDGQGRIWRSGPSEPQSVTLAAGQTQVTVAVPTLRVTGYSNIFIEIYRGATLDDAEFQLVSQIPNDLTVDSVAYVDTTSDLALAGGEPLYTNGGILPNMTIPGSPFVFTFGDRLMFINADHPDEVWFSNKITPVNGVRFNSEWVIRKADNFGQFFGAGPMADKVVLLKESATYAFDGDGPDDAGTGAFGTPQIVALGIGSNEPRSIAASKDGVFFNSTSDRPGIQLIDRGLSIAKDRDGMNFGAAVQRYANEVIVSAVTIPEQSQIRFYCRSGRTLVYDTIAGLWTTFQYSTAGDTVISAMAISGAGLFASTGFDLYAEDTSGATYFDRNSVQGPYTTTVTIPWIQGSGPKSFERLSEMIGQGKTVGDHTLTANLYTDLNDSTIVNTKTWALTAAANPRWNWEWIPRVQRMSAFKVSVSESSTTAGFQAEGITAYVGAKSGLARQPTSTRGP